MTVNAQDKVTLKNGNELIVHIIEKSDSEIKYKFENSTTNNTIFSTKLNNLKTIAYENGVVDLLCSLNPRYKYPVGITAGISLSASESEGRMFTGGIDYFFTPNLGVEINFGTSGESDSYYSFGGKYWLADKYSKSAFSPFTGLLIGGQYGVNFLEVPVGISYISKSGFQTSLHLSYLNYINALVYSETSRLNLEFRIGWRFK
jgi:hypothetical protein